MSDILTVEPLFIRDQDIRSSNVIALDICHACTRNRGAGQLEGVQRVNNLWRIYLKSRSARLELFLGKTILINGQQVPLYEQNPFASRQNKPYEPNDKITIKNVPLSVSNSEFVKMLEENHIELRSPVRYGKIRDLGGGLTEFKNGDRYVYVKPFEPPIPQKQIVASFPCFVIHHGKTTKCVSCETYGHKVGDEICPAKPSEEIYAFKGFRHPLSNHFPCKLSVHESEFRSLEHAYFWRMASEFGKPDLAESIRNCDHAGNVKKMSKEIADDEERWRWEKANPDVMSYLLEAKAKQCDVFKNCLLENKDKVLAEATKSIIWGTGLSPYVTIHTAPNYWPGKNWLGGMLTELTQKLLQQNADNEVVNEGEGDGDVINNGELEMQVEDYDQNLHTVDEIGDTDHEIDDHTSDAASLSSFVQTDELNVNPNLTQESSGETSRTSEVSGTPGLPRISASTASGSGTPTSRGRPSQRAPPTDRTSRGRARTSSAPKATSKKARDLTKKTAVNTPAQQDIRTVFKRSKPDSSPQDTEDSPVLKHVNKQVKKDNNCTK